MIHVDAADLTDADLRTLRNAYGREADDGASPAWLRTWARSLEVALGLELERRDRTCRALEQDLDGRRTP